MKKIFLFLAFVIALTVDCYAQEPGNNLGKSLATMKREFPELRYLKSNAKGDEYEDGYPEDGIATFFYFKNGTVIEECMICQSNDGFPIEWYNSMASAFNGKYYNSLRKNDLYEKIYVFSTFNVNLIFVSEGGKNTALIVYKATNNTNHYGNSNTSTPIFERPKQQKHITPAKTGKLNWYEIDYFEDSQYVRDMCYVGSYSATSTPSIFGSRTYSDAFQSAIKKIQKKAAKKGVRRLLVTYKSSMNDAFLTVKIEADGYK